MIETVIAVLVITFVFLCLFKLSQQLTGKIMLEHAAMRVARARAVGFNDFMCRKSARAAIIPVAGKRLWPEGPGIDEVARVPIYLASENPPHANAILEYEYWHSTDIDVQSGMGIAPVAKARVEMSTEEFEVEGNAKVESHFPFYMYDAGF